MSNCFDFKCPSCGDEDQIDIEATVWIGATENGTDPDLSKSGGCDFTPDSATNCQTCGHAGSLRSFTPVEAA